MSLFGNNQLVYLLGPTRSGKTELLCAIQDLKEIGERTIKRITADHSDPKFAKAVAKAHHSVTTSAGPMPLSRKMRLFRNSLFLRDCSGIEEGQARWITDFINTLVKPKPSKWKNGVIGVVVFDIHDIITDNAIVVKDVESSYRDFLETWGLEIYEQKDEDTSVSPEELMRGKKKRSKEMFRPPLGFLFVGSHLDCLRPEEIADAEKKVRSMVASMDNVAQHILELPPSLRIPPSHTVLADLYHLEGRLKFALEFFQELGELTELMKEGLNS